MTAVTGARAISTPERQDLSVHDGADRSAVLERLERHMARVAGIDWGRANLGGSTEILFRPTSGDDHVNL